MGQRSMSRQPTEMSALRKLAGVGGPAIRQQPVDFGRLESAFDSKVADSMCPLLRAKNGFYAFESALHVLPDAATTSQLGVVEWNTDSLWKKEYQGMADGLVCFAEDVFGMQFCLKNGAVSRFDPETGECEAMAPDLERWAGMILRDYEQWTGHRLAHDWQTANGSIPLGSRLVPITPFVLGGEFEVQNCRSVDAAKGMRYRASIAIQIRDLPDGATVKLRTID